MKKTFLIPLLTVVAVLCGCKSSLHADYTQYVDLRIGTGDHAHCFMGANVPFGLVQVGPTNMSTGWDWCSGYHISDSTIVGFGHMHLSGTGIGDLGDVAVMPVVGNPTLARGEAGKPETSIYSDFRHSTERMSPGFYAVHLDRYNIDVEITATKRVGLHKYTFPKATNAQVVIDLENAVGWDKPKVCDVRKVSDKAVEGYRFSEGWANDQKIYFYAEFSKPMKDFKVTKKTVEGLDYQPTYGQAFFDTNDGEVVCLKMALSPTSVESAKKNMEEEMPGWNFADVQASAKQAWNTELGKIDFQTSNLRDKKIFYTAMFHALIAPIEFCDVDGAYYGADKKVHQNEGHKNYSVYSLWDTYRAAHPLMTIIQRDKYADIINTMLNIYDEQGKLPVWHLVGNETNCMVGNPGVPVVADAVLKNIPGIDAQRAYNAMVKSQMLDERGLLYMKEYGYIPYEKESESVAKTLEYALADWSVAEVARKLGDEKNEKYFRERSKAYKHLYDPQVGFIRGKDANGKFRPGEYSPFKSTHRADDYTEGTGWQYLWLVPHDIEGLMGMFPSKEAFVTKLDSLFTVTGDMGEEASADISGLIGQYAHGNEPGHHTIYIYSRIGEGWKTAEKARYIMNELYNDQPGGLCGNEDVGEMSSWYILSSLGFYQLEPAGGRYYFGSPIMDKAVIHLGGSKTFEVIAHNNSPKNMYIKSIKLNGKEYNNPYIDYKDIMAGGVLEYEMSNEK